MSGYRAAILATLAITLVSCDGSLFRELGPDVEPTPTPAPSAAPTAAPSAAPSTAPSAAPTAAPSAPPPSAQSCKLAEMPDNGNCKRTSPAFAADVEKAIDEVIGMYPQFFDLTDVRDCGRAFRCPRVVNGKGFERRMVERLEAMGYCAKCDEECGVKDTNRFNEQYDVMVADGYLRRGEGSYRATCHPAAF